MKEKDKSRLVLIIGCKVVKKGRPAYRTTIRPFKILWVLRPTGSPRPAVSVRRNGIAVGHEIQTTAGGGDLIPKLYITQGDVAKPAVVLYPGEDGFYIHGAEVVLLVRRKEKTALEPLLPL